MKIVASFSGGKDSTAMILRWLELGLHLDEVVFFDTGWEWEQILAHVDKLEKYIAMPITRLKPEVAFTDLMCNKTYYNKKLNRDIAGYGFPAFNARWCTTMKQVALTKHLKAIKDDYRCLIGLSFDEQNRIERGLKNKHNIYPLNNWKMTEQDCLEYCNKRGFNWDGLYDERRRVSCWCCPLQTIGSLKLLHANYPEKWQQLLSWEQGFSEDYQTYWRGYQYGITKLNERFNNENIQRL